MDRNSKEFIRPNSIHYPFRHTDYSLPVSSCPPRGLFFLSCNDVFYLDFHLPVFIHNSVIVKCDIKSKYPEEYLTVDKEGSEKLLASKITHLLTFYLSQASETFNVSRNCQLSPC